MTIYVVLAPSVLEVFLSYEEADAFRRLIFSLRYDPAEVQLMSRKLVISGTSASADPRDYAGALEAAALD